MNSTPQERWDEWFSETHGGTGLPTWELDDCGSSSDEEDIEQ